LFIKSEKEGKRETYSKPIRNRAINKLLYRKMHENDAQQVDIWILGLECFYTSALWVKIIVATIMNIISTPGFDLCLSTTNNKMK
jgi:hypothetical protein